LSLVDETIRSVRRISTELRPGILDHLGLVAAVEWAAEEFQERTGIQCQVSLPETNPAIDAERATALFRIFQETLTNIARHAGATQVRIVLSLESGHFALEVRDNGRGIGEDQLSGSGSLGILGMRERALLLGGEFFDRRRSRKRHHSCASAFPAPIAAGGGRPVIRVLIADDHAILRRGLKEILVRELEGAVCGEAKDATEELLPGFKRATGIW
jgi:hypothetical protein